MSYKSKIVKVGNLAIGGDSPVVIQTMWKDRLSFDDLDAAAIRIEELARVGCGLARFAVPDLAAAEIVGRLAGMVSMPLVADIHFDHKIALRCMDFPIAKIRVNPGNIGSREEVRAVVEKAGEKGVAVRIGVNAGSLPRDLRDISKSSAFANRRFDAPPRENFRNNLAEAIVEAAERELAIFDEWGFSNVIVSIKASNIADTIKGNRILAGKSDVPLHIGVTEAGPLIAGTARSSAALAVLLAEGIGDTIRVSLSDSMENEVIAAREICGAAAEMAAITSGGEAAAARLPQGVKIVSCPRCARAGFDTHGFTGRWMPRLYGFPEETLDKKLTVAVMGCEVNGPTEAKHADLGITGSGSKVLIFRRGEIIRTVSIDEADEAFAEELRRL